MIFLRAGFFCGQEEIGGGFEIFCSDDEHQRTLSYTFYVRGHRDQCARGGDQAGDSSTSPRKFKWSIKVLLK